MTVALDFEVSEAVQWLENIDLQDGKDRATHYTQPMLEEIDLDYMDQMYERNGRFFSRDAATWSAEERLWVEESHTFRKEHWMT